MSNQVMYLERDKEGDIILTQQERENIQKLIDNPPPASDRFIKALYKYRGYANGNK